MTDEPDRMGCTGSEEPKLNTTIAGAFLSTIWIVPAAAVFIILLFLVIGHVELSDVGRRFVFAFVYSAFIGIPSSVLVSWVSFGYTFRYPRSIVPVRALILLATAVVGCLAAGVFFQLTGLLPRGTYWTEFRTSLPFSIVITLVFGLGISSFETMRYKLQKTTLELRTQQMEQERAYKLLAEARLSSLESRIHPHFLFNTLNSIAALIPKDPQRAEDTVSKLASLLRFSLNANHSGLVPLSQELKVVRDYLEIEMTRFGPRLRYSIEAPESLNDVKVPPLALQSLVENSVKHVVSQRAEGATIQITGSSHSGRVLLEVMDDGPGFSLEAITPEHGLGNLIARLELLFGTEGRLDVRCENQRTTVSLSFPA
jgi:two-component system LytT family sensor kinase